MENLSQNKPIRTLKYIELACLGSGFFVALTTGFYAGMQSVSVSARQELFADIGPFIPPPQIKTENCVALPSYPDPECTPGAVFSDVTKEQICVSGYTKTVRKVSGSLKKKIYRSYNIPYPQPFGSYELDHFIPLALGGNNDTANLFPFAADPRPGFIEKDLTVNYLRRKVCNGDISLSTAQRAISSYWVQVYDSISPSEKAELKRLYPSWTEIRK